MGAGLLCFVFLLDRDGYSGVATGLLVAGLISTVAGAFQVVGNLNSAGGSFLLALVGVAVCIVGTHGTRRASVWIGAALTALGVVAFVVAVVKPGSVSGASGALIGAAAILIGGPLVFELVRANRDQRESSGGTPSNASTTAATASQPTAPPAAPGSNLPPPPG